MKTPKEPKSFRYPRMYATFSYSDGGYAPNDECRLRILNPDGTAVWFDEYDGEDCGVPCWSEHRNSFGHWGPKTKNPKEMVHYLKEYCESCGMDCVYIGEIKMRGER